MAGSGTTEIVNAALALLGTSHRISGIDSGTPIANNARDIWNMVTRELLSLHPWNFALARKVVAASANASPVAGYEPEYQWRYQLPPDCLRWLPPDRDSRDRFYGVQEGAFVLSNHEGPLTLRYISDVVEPGRWPPLFVSAVTARLAYYLAEIETASQSIRDRMDNQYEQALSRARRADGLATGQRNGNGIARQSNWLRSRRQGFSGQGYYSANWPYGPCDDW